MRNEFILLCDEMNIDPEFLKPRSFEEIKNQVQDQVKMMNEFEKKIKLKGLK